MTLNPHDELAMEKIRVVVIMYSCLHACLVALARSLLKALDAGVGRRHRRPVDLRPSRGAGWTPQLPIQPLWL